MASRPAPADATPSPAASTSHASRPSPLSLLLNLVRGFLIGMAELVPGVSGGTVALVTGVYDELIDSAAHAVSAVKRLVLGPDRWKGFTTELRRSNWALLVPVLIGMASAVLLAAGAMAAFVVDHPEHARGLFLGLVAASIAVPLLMARDSRRSDEVSGQPVLGAVPSVLLVVAAAVVSFLLMQLAGGGGSLEPNLMVVFLAAAVAICALVVPGVSGSFFLLAIGLYAPTMSAIDERNLGYIAVFGLGAMLGLASFVQVLRYLLSRHRYVTLLVMTGLMIGSLRALWPWQAVEGEHDTGALLAPGEPLVGPLLLALLGALVVAGLVVVERRFGGGPERGTMGA
ncbi:DUF368 domain-containing protein [Kytococcus sedentarius]|uniref:DUF368 domain-containing protein n=1 Tax=Kytococcus sedentarius TaxID=1276 RepID=UPI0035BBCACF